MFGIDINLLMIIGLAVLAAGGVAWALLFTQLENEKKIKSRYKKVKSAETDTIKVKVARDRMQEMSKRKKSVQESLKELERSQKERDKKKTVTTKERLIRAGLSATPSQFYMVSAFFGVAVLLIGFLVGVRTGTPLLALVGIAFVASVGVPQFALRYLFNRRKKKFLEEFPNSLDVMVRSIKSGLPLNDALRLIAQEASEPVRSEFRKVVESQQMGLSVPEACARMGNSIPLQEVNFFAVVIAIQAQAGGNLSEALGNLSRVLRDRKKMRGKISALSMEAKASAAIIGSLPFVVAFLVYMTSPHYILILFTDPRGHLILGLSAVWMSIGVGVMKKMITFDI